MIRKTSKLGDICEFVRGPFGGSLKKNCFVKNGFSVYEQQHAIKNQCNDFRYFINQEKFNEMARFSVSPGDILMSCSGTIGKTTIIPKNAPRGIINQALLKITPSDLIDVRYLKFYMESNLFSKQLMEKVEGAAIQNVASVRVLKEITIDLPPLSEQLRIVSKVNSIFSKIEELIFNQKERQNNLEILISKMQNNLFADSTSSTNNVPLSKVGIFENGDRGKNYPSKKYQIDKGIAFVNAGDFSLDGEITKNKMVYISEERFNLLRSGKFKLNDILFCLRGSLGKSAFNKTIEKGAIASSLIIIRAKKDIILPDYLFAFMRSNIITKYIKETSSGAAQPNLSAKVVMNYKIPLFNFDRQNQISSKFWQLRKEGIKLNRIVKKQIELLDLLRRAILISEFQSEVQ